MDSKIIGDYLVRADPKIAEGKMEKLTPKQKNIINNGIERANRDIDTIVELYDWHPRFTEIFIVEAKRTVEELLSKEKDVGKIIVKKVPINHNL